MITKEKYILNNSYYNSNLKVYNNINNNINNQFQ